ncbi:MAG: beta-lactamase superfamily domain [Harvfovirus sp.]|uniref:Beta-lactamase superfamily domain n=1 Tax=Harvfovirus sp. TaxID=2487768 RepID=A0A3G5A224_9VIRU|nr:MAG: beta-lactamase superfamily domain [Harvfovirus sp.]
MTQFICTERKITKSITVRGGAVAARYAGFEVKGLKDIVRLDVGNPALRGPLWDHLLLTHLHGDHFNDLGSVMNDISDSPGRSVPTIYCPKFAMPFVKNKIDADSRASKELDGSMEAKIHNKYRLVGVSAGEKFPFIFDGREKKQKREAKTIRKAERKVARKLFRKQGVKREPFVMPVDVEKKEKTAICLVEVIQCYHTTVKTDCFGYGFWSRKTKLKPEYAGFSPEQLKNLSDDGVKITYDVETPEFCYLGDTDHRVLYEPGSHPEDRVFSKILEQYPVVIGECTYLNDVDTCLAEQNRHMIWKHWEPYVLAHPATQFYFTHFSAKHPDNYIRKFFDHLDLPNVEPFLPLDIMSARSSIKTRVKRSEITAATSPETGSLSRSSSPLRAAAGSPERTPERTPASPSSEYHYCCDIPEEVKTPPKKKTPVKKRLPPRLEKKKIIPIAWGGPVRADYARPSGYRSHSPPSSPSSPSSPSEHGYPLYPSLPSLPGLPPKWERTKEEK